MAEAPPPALRQKTIVEALERRKRNRTRTWQEWLDAERRYNEMMKFLRDHYRNAEEINSILTQDEIDILVPQSIQEIIDISDEVIRQLENNLQNYDADTTQVGNFLLELVPPSLEPYFDLIASYEQCITLVRAKTETNEQFCVYQQEVRREAVHGCDFISIRVFPNSRFARYELLAREIVRNSPDDHPDKATMEQVHGELCRWNKRLFAELRRRERQAHLLELENDFGGAQNLGFKLVKDTRRIIQRGTLKKNGKSVVHCALLTDMFLCVKPPKNLVVYNRPPQLLHCFPVDETFRIETLEQGKWNIYSGEQCINVTAEDDGGFQGFKTLSYRETAIDTNEASLDAWTRAFEVDWPNVEEVRRRYIQDGY